MADKNIAIAFFETFIPIEILNRLDLGSLTLTNTSYINEQLDESFSDIVFQCKENQSKNEQIQITILLEHKSVIDKNVAIQILKYLVLGYEANLKNHTKISAIIPILFYHGNKEWSQFSLDSLFNQSKNNYRQFIPFYEIIFVDLFRYSDEFIQQLSNLFLSSALLTQKYSRNPNILIKKIVNIFNGLDPDDERNLFTALTVYYLQLIEINKYNIIEKIVYLSPKIKKNVMSTYDQLIEEGKVEGKIETQIKVITKGFQNGATVEFLSLQTELSTNEIISILKKEKLI